MSFILAKKLKMTSIFAENGDSIPVTVLQAGPCTVTQVKNDEKDGYAAVQLGFDTKKEKHQTKPEKGHLKDLPAFRHLGEFRLDEATPLKRGDQVLVDTFQKGEVVDCTATSKGHGFSGVIKRHNFSGGPAAHGSQSHRIPGSTGSRFPQHTPKGRKLPGHYGVDTVTVKNITVMDVDASLNLLVVKGAVPGHNGTLVRVETVVANKEKKVKK